MAHAWVLSPGESKKHMDKCAFLIISIDLL